MTRKSCEPMPMGSLMQPTDRPPVDYLNMHEFTSSIAIDMLTRKPHKESKAGQQGHADEGSTDRKDDDAEQRAHLMAE